MEVFDLEAQADHLKVCGVIYTNKILEKYIYKDLLGVDRSL